MRRYIALSLHLGCKVTADNCLCLLCPVFGVVGVLTLTGTGTAYRPALGVLLIPSTLAALCAAAAALACA